MRVDIWSDVVCPWCYVGKARFEKALRAFGHRDEVEVVYRSFELDPDYPKGQRDTVVRMLSRKYGMAEEEALAADARVAALARAEGLGFDSDRPIGNTFDIHRVLHLGRESGVQRELVAAVNEAYFAQALQVFDRDVLAEVAADAGLDYGKVGEILDGDAYADAVRQDERMARELGIGGVPFFVFDMALAVSGAQSPETFASALNQARPRRG
ncbi:DsbA family oxidoreductase [Trebonia sp.]|uniref:DsbA family oxidoreductase n=1 Tax=Trebonia sp. TaxID=2767075 RepID=UPI00260AB39A|nr:DsbA family oxidoreductase [Trebonia sp.]